MPTPSEMAERHSQGLAELAELGLSLARDLHACALAAETPAEKQNLALAFHRLSRSVRQTYALEAKLERDRQTAAREDAAETERQTVTRVHRRRDQLQFAAERLIWYEAEPDRLRLRLNDLLDNEVLSETFLDEPLDLQIERIARALGLSLAKAAEGRVLTGENIPPDWRSSA